MSVTEAAARIAPFVVHTPVVSSDALDDLCGVSIRFKCENFQWTGAFKARGAMNAILCKGGGDRSAGVVTHSSGNHGAALARAARKAGVPAFIVMPQDASAFKRRNVQRFGGHVVTCGPTLAAREACLAELVEDTGAAIIPPYDDRDVIDGQGTATAEFLHDAVEINELWLPVGGGGLAAGAIEAVGEAECRVQVVGAEPELADDAAQSMRTGVRQTQRPPVTIADGLRTALGMRNFAIFQSYDLPIRCVGEEEISRALDLMTRHLNMIVEPSSAVPLAALLRWGPIAADSQVIGIIISGGNLETGANAPWYR